MEPLISIIVPIYNSEKYLENCLDSILCQTYLNLEVILINDGSTDASESICEKYLRKDSRIKYFMQENKGSVAARKKGLELAQGEWVGFVDSDDWIESETYEYYMSIIRNCKCDIVASGYVKDFEDGRPPKIVTDKYEEGLYTDLYKDIYPTMIHNFELSSRGLDCTLVSRLFKKEILLSVNEGFDDRIFYGDDVLIYTYCLMSQSIYISKKVFYHYVIHNNSICRRINPNMIINNGLIFDYLKKRIRKNYMYESLLRQLKRYMIDLEFHNLEYLYGINIKSFAEWEFGIEKKVLDSKIIIYGASACGQALYNKVMNEYQGEIVDWVDTNPEGKEEQCRQIINNPDILYKQHNYEYIIIAVESNRIADNIKSICINKYKVPAEKIIYGNYKCDLRIQ